MKSKMQTKNVYQIYQKVAEKSTLDCIEKNIRKCYYIASEKEVFHG